MAIDPELNHNMQNLQAAIGSLESQLAGFSKVVRAKIGTSFMKAAPDQQMALQMIHEELTDIEASLVTMKGKLNLISEPIKTGIWPW